MEDFVTFETAKKLKEKGFREDCIAYYHTDGELLYNRDQYRGGDYKSLLRSYNSLPKNPIGCEQIDAPTISQVLKWLREEKLILIGLSPMQEYDCNEIIEWCCTIFKANKQGGLSWQEEFYYQSYEHASLAGIEYVLDNLI